MWTTDVIKARFLEAVDVERRMLVKGGPGSGNAWPSYRFDEVDMAGWDDQARLDHLELWQGRKVTKSPEISRWEETFFEWTALIPMERRSLVWRWAQCKAAGRSFSKWCDDHGIVRMTAYNRLNRVFENLAFGFSKEARLLRLADPKWDLQDPPSRIQILPTLKNSASANHPPFRTENHFDLLKTPAAVAEFSKHLSDHNARQRKLRERRLKKALRGVPHETEAA
jgi:hypothetical protein